MLIENRRAMKYMNGWLTPGPKGSGKGEGDFEEGAKPAYLSYV